jgi:hypothetical protein
MASASEQQVPMQPPPTGAVIRRAAPRLLRDGFGPLAIFFAGWKLIGLSAGIGMAMLFGVAVFTHERRAGRPAMIVRVALVLVLLRSVVGFSSGNARVYLAQEVAIDTLIACLVLGLLVKGRPLAAVFAREIYPLPQEMSESPTFKKAMSTITALVRLTALLTLSTDRYVLVSALSDAPFLVAILAWSVHHTSRAFRNSAQWAPRIVAAEALPVRSPSAP